PKGDFDLPCLTSSFMNQGLNYFAPRDNLTILSNVITIPSNSDIYRAYYQPNEFTVLSDAYAIQWKSEYLELTENQYLFFVQCINKVTDLNIYSYKNKLGGWNTVKEKEISLPVKDGDIDYTYMERFIT
ncbi:TPA: restriction endonuclease subunit S, partial [Staphylococcus pseudintermedius]|nr:restriction endonuclease subunit S [Staphylococcus pseudintermedius]